MYDFLMGKLVSKTPLGVVVDVNGVGYQLQVPVSSFAALPVNGEPVKLFTHLVVREDAMFLCGFAAEEERSLFRLLLSVSGIGPKLALTILSAKNIDELKQAIAQGSLVTLTGIPGIGKKTAEHIIIELREKIVIQEGARAAQAGTKPTGEEALLEDSLQALMELGYKRQTAKSALEKVMNGSQAKPASVQDLIRASLKYV